MSAEAHLDHNSEDWPAWGTLALDSFMLDNWRPDSELADDEQRLQLVRDYVQAGYFKRKEHDEKAARGEVTPTESEVANILRPVRVPPLRRVAVTLRDMRDYSLDAPIWLRTDYQDPGRHKTFCEGLPGEASLENLYYGSFILSDARYYDFDSWRKVLDILPEILDSQDWTGDNYRGGEPREKFEREYMACPSESPMDYDGLGLPTPSEQLLADQQYQCCMQVLLVEDAKMYATEPPQFHFLWLDEFGNVIRENRVEDMEAGDYFAVAGEGMAAEQGCFWAAEIGPKYVQGAEYGPPFHIAQAGSDP